MLFLLYHLTLSAQYAAEDFPLAMFLPCLDLKDLRLDFIFEDSPFLGLPAVLAPCSPKRITFSFPPSHDLTTCDFFGCEGVRLGVLQDIAALSTLPPAL